MEFGVYSGMEFRSLDEGLQGRIQFPVRQLAAPGVLAALGGGSGPVPGISRAFWPEASCIWPRRRTTSLGSTTVLHAPCKQLRVQHSLSEFGLSQDDRRSSSG